MSETKEVSKKPSAQADGAVSQEQAVDLQTKLDVILASLPVLMAAQAEEASERQRERENKSLRAKARARQSSNLPEELRARVLRCNHLKGGRHRRPGDRLDYALTDHVFITREERVKCNLCGLEVWSSRQGGKVPPDNQTTIWRCQGDLDDNNVSIFVPLQNPSHDPANGKPGIGFAEAKAMLAFTTNTTTSSEIPDSQGQATAALNNAQAEIEALKKQIAEMALKPVAATPVRSAAPATVATPASADLRF